MGIEPEPTGAPVPESAVGLRNSRFPERVGRTRAIPTALEIAATPDLAGQPIIDPVVLRSVGSMDGRE